MPARMLINAQRPEELRVAIVVDGRLELFQTALAESGLFRGNIYRGVVVNLQPALNAAFVDIGSEKHGFLALHDIVPQAFHRRPSSGTPHRLDEVLERGQPILVQVTKDPGGQKGAALTTNMSVAGRYLVFTPFDEMRGVSRKVEDEQTRKQLKELAQELELPAGAGVIVRTNAIGQTKAALAKDLAALLRLWKKILAASKEGRGPRLLYSDQDLIVQALRDFLDPAVSEVWVDDDSAFAKAQAFMKAFMPRAKTKLLRYTERMPLFSRFDLEPQIESILSRTVALPSGGSIVIDATEALTAIDVNSGKTRSQSQEEAIFQVNKEAAVEVARQLRLRDIGGLVVVDFIDMRSVRHQREVERTMREALKSDRARCWVGRISPNGLLEINRQRIKPSLGVRTRRPCPTCGGVGSIASPEAVALGLLRRIEAAAASGKLRAVRIELHPELADALQNNRRQELAALEREFDLRIEIIAAPGLHRSEQRVEFIHHDAPVARSAAATQPVVSAADLAPEPTASPRLSPTSLPAAENGLAPEAERAPTPPVAEVQPEKRRRRRRGGRRRKSEETAPAVAASSAEATPPANPPLAKTPVAKKRRQSTRRRKSAAEPAADNATALGDQNHEPTTEGAQPSPTDGTAGLEPAPATPTESSSSHASKSLHKRRRHRRRNTRSEQPTE